MLSPTSAFASDFGALAAQAIFYMVIIGVIALILGVATSAALVAASRNKWCWLGAPLFAVVWFAAVFKGVEVWNDRPRPATLGPEPQVPIAAPEHIPNSQ
jgi:hypothetical protein